MSNCKICGRKLKRDPNIRNTFYPCSCDSLPLDDCKACRFIKEYETQVQIDRLGSRVDIFLLNQFHTCGK